MFQGPLSLHLQLPANRYPEVAKSPITQGPSTVLKTANAAPSTADKAETGRLSNEAAGFLQKLKSHLRSGTESRSRAGVEADFGLLASATRRCNH